MQRKLNNALDFRQLILNLCKPERPVVEKRREERVATSLSLMIQPLDFDFRPDGEPFWALSRDISSRGLGFVNPEPIQHRYVRLELIEHGASTIARVCHSTSIGLEYPLYLVGVQFLTGED